MIDSLNQLGSTDGMVDYNENSLAQQQNANRHASTIRNLAEQVSTLSNRLNITDYGCGPGQSAIETVRPALDVWSNNTSSKHISVCHADQPGNDWNALINLAFGPDGYMSATHVPQVRTSVGSFYGRLMPDRSVTLATCFAASHWLSKSIRLDAPGTIWFADLTGENRKKMWQQAQSDWRNFLRLRAEEIQSGGYLLVSTLGSVPEPGEINGIAASGRGIYRALQHVTAEMTDEGRLDRKTADSFVFGLWFMTSEEARGSIENDALLADAFEVDTLDAANADESGDLFSTYINQPAEYAHKYAGYVRAFACSTLRSHLFAPSAKTDDEIDGLETDFFDRLETLYREKTSAYAFEQWFMTIILRRK
ncbi:SAM dependent carboxyl methyltransferase [Roseibium album]|nr:SAM dependent carboxyl methyltransferase [Roseibium album]